MDLIVIGEHSTRANSIIELTELLPQKIGFEFKSESIKNHIESTGIYEEDLWFDNEWKIVFEDHCFTNLEEQVNSNNDITFKGPYDLTVHIGMNSMSISTPIRWRTFLKNQQVQKDFRVIAKQFIESIGGKKAIYTADNGTKSSMYDQYIGMGRTLEEIIKLMELGIGKPTEELSDILSLTSDQSTLDGYFIDVFETNSK